MEVKKVDVVVKRLQQTNMTETNIADLLLFIYFWEKKSSNCLFQRKQYDFHL